ncbi:putative PurR-regulated permease PerM [Motilibacter rhizosphaerae]|uniref:Putative PurR-regulated permease PerM n=1 Tax=Motilibacter rhizosphaerae TaxID=598652 RepID=A0A4V2F4L7_9ACTN|nr:AI-2E family transporter [Motilibacter rhizosphaerae]RZS89759.1 putative PurR-regulated permease PerM [Motilibacter rhizosphaerae]
MSSDSDDEVARDLPQGEDPRPGAADASIEDKERAAHRSAPPPPKPLKVRDGWPTRRIFSAACTVAAGFFLVYFFATLLKAVTSELMLVVLSGVIAAGLDPVVALLTRRGLKRQWSVALVATVFILAVVGFFAAIVPPIVDQTGQLVKAAPDISKELQDRSTLIGRLNTQYHLLDTVTSRLGSSSGSTAGSSGSGLPVGGILNVSAAIFGTLVSSLTVLVLTIYFLANMPGMRRAVYRTIPASRRERAVLLGDEIFARVGGYVLGNIVTSVIAGVGTMVFLEIAGVPYAGALGLLVAVLDLIPIVGSTIGGTLVTLVALTVSLPVAVASLVFYVVYRLLEDYLLTPRVMNRTVHVPPVLTIVALLLGGALFGIEGAFLAIPVAAATELVISEVVWPKLDSV